MIIVGLFIYSFGLTAFLLPEKVVMGGMAGIGSLIYYLSGFPVGYSVFIINAFLLVLAYKGVGRKFVIRTIFASFAMSFIINILQPLFTEPFIQDQPFVNIILGSVICGLGIGIVFINNGSTGGTDIVAAMINRKRDISIGRTMLYCDLLVISSSYFLFHSVAKIVYGLIILVIVSNMADLVINSNRRSVQFTIFSKHYDKIADAINSQVNRGVTVVDGMGWYSKEPMKVLLVLAKQNESVTIFRIIKSIDPNAFISQAKVNGVYGEGFDTIKVK